MTSRGWSIRSTAGLWLAAVMLLFVADSPRTPARPRWRLRRSTPRRRRESRSSVAPPSEEAAAAGPWRRWWTTSRCVVSSSAGRGSGGRWPSCWRAGGRSSGRVLPARSATGSGACWVRRSPRRGPGPRIRSGGWSCALLVARCGAPGARPRRDAAGLAALGQTIVDRAAAAGWEAVTVRGWRLGPGAISVRVRISELQVLVWAHGLGQHAGRRPLGRRAPATTPSARSKRPTARFSASAATSADRRASPATAPRGQPGPRRRRPGSARRDPTDDRHGLLEDRSQPSQHSYVLDCAGGPSVGVPDPPAACAQLVARRYSLLAPVSRLHLRRRLQRHHAAERDVPRGRHRPGSTNATAAPPGHGRSCSASRPARSSTSAATATAQLPWDRRRHGGGAADHRRAPPASRRASRSLASCSAWPGRRRRFSPSWWGRTESGFLRSSAAGSRPWWWRSRSAAARRRPAHVVGRRRHQPQRHVALPQRPRATPQRRRHPDADPEPSHSARSTPAGSCAPCAAGRSDPAPSHSPYGSPNGSSLTGQRSGSTRCSPTPATSTTATPPNW